MQISSNHRGLLNLAMDDPVQWVAMIRYIDEGGNVTERTVSPLKELTGDRVQVYCLGREALRTLRLARILSVKLRFSSDVLPPEGVQRLVEHFHKKTGLT